MTKSRKKTKKGAARRGNSGSSGNSYAKLSHSELRMMLAYRNGALDSLNSLVEREKAEIGALISQIANTPESKVVASAAPAGSGSKKPGRPSGQSTKTSAAPSTIPSGNFSSAWPWKQKIYFIINNGGGNISSGDMLAFFKKNERGYNEAKYRNILSQYLLSMKTKGEIKATKAKVGRGFTYQTTNTGVKVQAQKSIAVSKKPSGKVVKKAAKPASKAAKISKPAASIPTGNYSNGWTWKQKILFIIKNGGGKISSADMLAFFKKNEKGYNEGKYRNILSQYLLTLKTNGTLKAVKAKEGRGYIYQAG